MKCIAHEYGCGCTDKCRADIIPPARQTSLFAYLIAAIIVGIVVGCSAYVGLSRAEQAYQAEART